MEAINKQHFVKVTNKRFNNLLDNYNAIIQAMKTMPIPTHEPIITMFEWCEMLFKVEFKLAFNGKDVVIKSKIYDENGGQLTNKTKIHNGIVKFEDIYSIMMIPKTKETTKVLTKYVYEPHGNVSMDGKDVIDIAQSTDDEINFSQN
ncbi:MAG: hypothetical protein [Microviridae sp.]|nr:MAG: hypothetical protein [Microviridae sp.]